MKVPLESMVLKDVIEVENKMKNLEQQGSDDHIEKRKHEIKLIWRGVLSATFTLWDELEELDQQ